MTPTATIAEEGQCDGCGREVPELHRLAASGDCLCPACFGRLVPCQACGEPTEPDEITHGLCDTCRDGKVRCRVCRRWIPEAAAWQLTGPRGSESYLCPRCVQAAVRPCPGPAGPLSTDH